MNEKIKKFAEKQESCIHIPKWYEVDEDLRGLICKNCGKILDVKKTGFQEAS
jgi:hypothetical protein